MNEYLELYKEPYVLYDHVMNPLAAQLERKPRRDCGTRRGRHSTSSSSAFDQPSSSHLNNDDDDGNNEGTSYGYVKNHKKTMKNGQTRTRETEEHKRSQRFKAKARKSGAEWLDMATRNRQDSEEFHTCHQDAHDDRAILRARISTLARERSYYRHVAIVADREAMLRPEHYSNIGEKHKMASKKTPMSDAAIKALIAQGVADALADYEANRG
ncbi:hypothetical protein Tco_0658623, partial [Tanacetum coccineum]